ncbi:MAG: carbon-nitrogen hydrolase family protein, partial [Isosphaeraceae bacterium]
MSSPGTIRAAAVQMEPKLGNVEENLDRILAGLEQAAADGAKLIVFPECALSGYGFGSREEGLAHAVASDGREVVKVAELARRTQCGCIFGLLERAGSRLFNACVLIGPDGVKGIYRKVHLPFLGVDMFVDPGDLAFAVHELEGLRIGMHICYQGLRITIVNPG